MFDATTKETPETTVAAQFGLDADAVRKLQQVGHSLHGSMDDHLAAFYRWMNDQPVMANLLGKQNQEQLKGAQRRHWDNLFQDVCSDSFRQETLRIGAAHERIGLGPDLYLSGYGFLAERMIRQLMGRSKATDDVTMLLRAIFYDMSLSLTAYGQLGAASAVRDEILTISDMLERETGNTVSEMAHKAAQFGQIAKQVSSRSTDLQQLVDQLSNRAEHVSTEIGTIADAARHLEALGEQIGQRIEYSARTSGTVLDHTDHATQTVSGLSELAGDIASVVVLIRNIAAQTKLLALNATIEAARAGEVGKGFAVVAAEVKALANQTESSLGEVSRQAADIRGGTNAAVDRMDLVGRSISEMHSIAGEIARSASDQRTASVDIVRSVERAADGAAELAGSMNHIRQQAEENSRAAATLSQVSANMNHDMDQLHDRIMAIVGASSVNEDRLHAPVAIEATLDHRPVMIVDLSLTGALVRLRDGWQANQVPLNRPMDMMIPGIGVLLVRTMMPSNQSVHVQFTSLKGEQRRAIRTTLSQIVDRDRTLGNVSRQAAQELTDLLTQAVRSNRISLDDLFDESYQPVTGTNPLQYTARFTQLTDQLFPAIQERVVTQSQGIVFCAAVDRNGYLPTHNQCYSKPQRPNDPIWNMANARNRRIFDDRAGLLAAHNKMPGFVQTYERDMGGGVVVFLKEIDSPIIIADRLWGNLRLSYKI